MELRNSFGSHADTYDRLRPRYCDGLFGDIFARAQGKNALEIGSGSGQATEPFLKKGYAVTAVEISREFCALLAEKYKDFPITVKNIPFESLETHEKFDVIFSATAFHWVDRESGFAKLYGLLKPGGLAALFWNVPHVAYDNKELHDEIQRAYSSGKEWKNTVERKYTFCPEYLAKYGFNDIEIKEYKGYRTLTSGEYLELLETYSDHKTMEINVKTKLYTAIKAAIDRCGGTVNICDNMELYIGRKPS